MKKFLILAGNGSEFIKWQKENPGITGFYAANVDAFNNTFLGMVFDCMMMIGTFSDREDGPEIYKQALKRTKSFQMQR